MSEGEGYSAFPLYRVGESTLPHARFPNGPQLVQNGRGRLLINVHVHATEIAGLTKAPRRSLRYRRYIVSCEEPRELHKGKGLTPVGNGWFRVKR